MGATAQLYDVGAQAWDVAILGALTAIDWGRIYRNDANTDAMPQLFRWEHRSEMWANIGRSHLDRLGRDSVVVTRTSVHTQDESVDSCA